jgi:translation initiation factor IF-1
MTGVVTETLPSSLYRVRLDEGGIVTAHIADRMDRNFVRILVGDRVRVEMTKDVTKGRIVEKL